MLRRASSPRFEMWWRRVESVGYCAHPIQLSGTDTAGRRHCVWTRCNNRRQAVCPSCSDLYARDTWQLVHAGAAGGHHDIPAEVAARPQVFTTLTAPSYGAVHNATGTPCHTRKNASSAARCSHGNQLRCNIIHSADDPVVGQPLCRDCYDYLGHVLFTWHLPELWRRFTIALRRAVATHLKTVGVKPGSVRVSFVKVVELQARAIPHIHALIRLDPPPADNDTTKSGDHNRHGPAAPRGGGEPHPVDDPHTGWSSPITAAELAALIQRAARRVRIDITTDDHDQQAVQTLRFGTQIDTQPLTPETTTASINSETDNTAVASVSPLSPRRVAAYLAKYVTKSLHDFGVTARRLTAEAIGELAVSEHVRAILSTIAELAEHTASAGPSLAGIGLWLHTLGYRGHITTKSRHYSTTMGALRTARATWTRHQTAKHSQPQNDPRSAHFADDVTTSTGRQHQPIDTDEMLWEFDRAGHTSAGDRVLVISAALRHIGARITGITESRTVSTRIPPPPRGAG
ncbi:MAG: replication initiator [Mycolicibacter sinensis]